MYESEKITRKKRIDQQLKSVGWLLIPYTEGMDISSLTNHAIEEYQTANGPADYAFVVKGKMLGCVEAKKLEVVAANVLEQAKRYSKGAPETVDNWNGYHIHFLYSSNGELIYHLDARKSSNISRQIYQFPTPDAIYIDFHQNKAASLKWLIEKPIETPGLRPYQKEAIEAYENGLGEGKRQMLLAMATGTGKTFTTVNLVYRMLASGYAKRILVLVEAIHQLFSQLYLKMFQVIQTSLFLLNAFFECQQLLQPLLQKVHDLCQIHQNNKIS